jgi:hypothetical protein
MTGGVYAYRTRKPNARFRIPILSYHWAYVGQTSSFWHRDRQHMGTTTNSLVPAKPWADLEPRVYRLTLPNWLWLRLTVETLAILVLWPVYNDRKNRWNPRRVPIVAAIAARARRDAGHRDTIIWPFGWSVVLILVALLAGHLGGAW